MLFCFCILICFTWKSELKRGTKREREILHSPVHSPNGYNGQRWTKSKLGTRSPLQDSHMGAGPQSPGSPSSLPFQATRQRAWSEIEQLRPEMMFVWNPGTIGRQAAHQALALAPRPFSLACPFSWNFLLLHIQIGHLIVPSNLSLNKPPSETLA